MNVKLSVLELPHWTTIKKLPALQQEKEDETFYYHPEVHPEVNHAELPEEIRQETQIARKHLNIQRVQNTETQFYCTMNLINFYLICIYPRLFGRSPDRRSVSDEKDNLASAISRDDDNITAPDEDNIF